MKARAKVRVLVGAFLLVMVGTSFASHLANHDLTQTTTGARFDGAWEWNTMSEGHGGWHYWGTLQDTITDGDEVYTKARPAGYSYTSYFATSQNREIYDPQATRTDSASFFVCRDRGFPYSDNCSSDEINTFTR
jgi:hypothetical protein